MIKNTFICNLLNSSQLALFLSVAQAAQMALLAQAGCGKRWWGAERAGG